MRKIQQYVLPFGLMAFVFAVALTRCTGPAMPHYVALTWNPPAARAGVTLAGYNIYRRTAESNSLVKIAEKVTGPPYEDRLVSSGRKYVYVVTSVDATGRESGFSAPAYAEIP
jgi:fibronectin type 3 domain-containing protein